MNTKFCSYCNRELFINQFIFRYINKLGESIYYPDCLECKSKRDKEYRDNNKVKLSGKRSRDSLKYEVFGHYSNWKFKCACCGEKIYAFLTLDHINNDGAEHRRSLNTRDSNKIYRDLKNKLYPEGYQILCYNCNCGRKCNNGVCPHKQREIIPIPGLLSNLG